MTPLDDGPILKMAWNDPDEKCREIARERIGGLTEFVGVQETHTSLKNRFGAAPSSQTTYIYRAHSQIAGSVPVPQ